MFRNPSLLFGNTLHFFTGITEINSFNTERNVSKFIQAIAGIPKNFSVQ